MLSWGAEDAEIPATAFEALGSLNATVNLIDRYVVCGLFLGDASKYALMLPMLAPMRSFDGHHRLPTMVTLLWMFQDTFFTCGHKNRKKKYFERLCRRLLSQIDTYYLVLYKRRVPPPIVIHLEGLKTMLYLINRPWDLERRIVRGRIIWQHTWEISVGD